MKKRSVSSLRVAIPQIVLPAVLVLALAQSAAALDAETEARIQAADQGASSIDVSAYPPAMQEAYELFSSKCSQCHTLSRPINSQYALPGEWSRYVKRMMRKPDSGISSSEGKAIYKFLSYDSIVRKQELIDAKLSTLEGKDKSEALEAIEKLRSEYNASK